MNGAFPENYSQSFSSDSMRTAFPSAVSEPIYRVTASKDDTIIYDSAINNGDITIAEDKSSFTILQLETGKNWIITVSIYASSDTTFTRPLMSASYPKTFSANDNVLSHTFNLKPNQTQGNGNVYLTITVPSNAFDSFTTTCLSDNSAQWNVMTGLNTTTASISDNSPIAAGSYLVRLDFKKSGFVIYSDIQTINVFKNMTTNKWINNGGNSAIQNNGTYNISSQLITYQTQLYIGPNKYNSNASDSDGNGSRFSPYASLSKALTYIENFGDSTKNYVLWISGGVNGGLIQGTTTVDATLNGKATSITIKGLNGINSENEPLDILSGYADKLGDTFDFKDITTDTVFQIDEFKPVLTIKTTVPIILDCICITKGAANFGAGISIDSGANVSINNKTVINNNRAKKRGGGVYVEGTLIMNDGKICNNTSYDTTTPNIGASGGGICISSAGTFTLNNGEISSNKCNGDGGGFFLISNTESLPSFTMNGGKIYNNSADGVYSYEGNEIGRGSGGGINISAGSFIMNSGEISNNKVTYSGAGLAIGSGKVEIKNGTIKDNVFLEAYSKKGAAIFMNSTANSELKLGAEAEIVISETTTHDIYLCASNSSGNAHIKLTGSLSKHNPDKKIIITPEGYASNRTLVEAAGSGITLSNEVAKFEIKINEDTPEVNYSISATGTLIQSQ